MVGTPVQAQHSIEDTLDERASFGAGLGKRLADEYLD
jgi:hypothetical protein